MKLTEFFGGLVVGSVAGLALKEKIFGTKDNQISKQNEVESLYAENEKLSKRNKDLEHQVEDLLVELKKIRKESKANDENQFDLEDKIDKTAKDLKNIRLQNEELSRKVKEYKFACEAQEAEILLLKQRLN